MLQKTKTNFTKNKIEDICLKDYEDMTEQDLRIQLAAAYRIVEDLGWSFLIFGHLTVRVPGPEKHFLINPYGLMYDEVNASNLVKIDLEGNIVEPSDWDINPAGFIIHSAIHSSKPDAHCVLHTHTTAGMGMASLKKGLINIDFIKDCISYSLFQRAINADIFSVVVPYVNTFPDSILYTYPS